MPQPVTDFRPISRRRLYQEVSEQLEHMIRNGVYAEGDALPPERELMERFKVGRPAIREALLSLQKSGLVALSNGERARVSRPTPAGVLAELSAAARVILASDDGVRQFQSARRLIEMALVREAARRASARDIELLRVALEHNRSALGDPETFRETDVAFHLEIARIAASPLLVGVQQALAGWLSTQRVVTLKHEGAAAEAFEFHRRIFEAVAAGNPDTAETVMSEHIERVAALYWMRSRRKPHGSTARQRALRTGRPSL